MLKQLAGRTAIDERLMERHTKKLRWHQYSLRSFLVAIALLNVLLAFPQIVLSLPLPLVIAILLLVATCAILGVLLFGFVSVLTITIWLSPETRESKHANLRRCLGLLLISLLTIAPAVSLGVAAAFRYPNPWQVPVQRSRCGESIAPLRTRSAKRVAGQPLRGGVGLESLADLVAAKRRPGCCRREETAAVGHHDQSTHPPSRGPRLVEATSPACRPSHSYAPISSRLQTLAASSRGAESRSRQDVQQGLGHARVQGRVGSQDVIGQGLRGGP